MKADSMTETAVQDTLQRLIRAYERRDMEAALACFAPDGDVVMYGTGADEKRIGLDEIREQMERDWAQSESTAISFDESSVSAAGSVAWAAVDARFGFRIDGQEGTLPARISFVLERRQEKWYIVHAHFSTATAGQAEGESF